MSLSGYKIGQVAVSPGLVLSPMSGVTTCSFRKLIKELNPNAVGLLVSEFISVEAMTRKVPRTLAMMRFEEIERPFCIQIFGYDIQRMRDAAVMCQDAGVDTVDINCGCPAPKVVRKGGGAELMRQPQHLQEIIKACRAAVKIPLTIKIRAGWDDHSKNAVEVARMAEGEGVDALAVHGRTRAQLYRGDADWELVGAVKNAVKIPVAGSGDVVDRESAEMKLALSGADGIFIGRGALANPFVFSEVLEGEKRVPLRETPQEAARILIRYLELMREEIDPRGIPGKIKQLASGMCRGISWRKELLLAQSLALQEDLLKRAFEGSYMPKPSLAPLQEPPPLSCGVEL